MGEYHKVLKYPGSKWRIASQLAELIPPHRTYAELYFGSGALFFRKPPSAIETINDLDGEVVNLFCCIQRDSERLARLVGTTPYSREVYEKHCSMEPGDYASSFQRAVGFLIRCWQSIGTRTDGSRTGWKNDVSRRERSYSVWDWYRLPGWIVEIAERLKQVQIENRPALELLERFNDEAAFLYIDPPYLFKTRNRRQYAYEMADADHEELLQKSLKSKARIMISGYESEMYNDYLSGWHKEYFVSHAEYGFPRQEVVWMNYEMYRQENLFDMLEG